MCQERSARAPRRFLDNAFRIAVLAALGLLVEQALAAPARAEPRPPAPGPAMQAHAAALHEAAPDLDRGVLDLALAAHAWAAANGGGRRDDILTVIDYSLPSTRPRLWVFDLDRDRVLFHELVAHGIGSGDNLAARFSNRDGTHESSLGLFRTGETYEGKNGYSLRLHGLEAGTNDQAFARTIVMHGAWYVSRDHAERYGRLGRSWGCPAVPVAMAKPIIDAIRGGSLLFAYYPKPDWLRTAAYGGDRAGGVSGVRTAAR
jgi:hypothetical protein